jgi:hypothetical protein
MIAKKLRGHLSWRPLLIYVYFEDEPGRRLAAKLLSKDEARMIAVKRSRRICYRARRNALGRDPLGRYWTGPIAI